MITITHYFQKGMERQVPMGEEKCIRQRINSEIYTKKNKIIVKNAPFTRSFVKCIIR